MMKLMVQVSKEGTSETHRWVPFPKVYLCIAHCVKLMKKQGNKNRTYMVQLSTVDSNFFIKKPFKALQGKLLQRLKK